MVKNVKSKNQKGGITAGTVNIGNVGTIGAEQPPKRSNQWLYAIAAIATIIGVVIGIWEPWKGKGETGMSDDKKNVFNVESHDQKGGITAGQVNIGQQPRVLNDKNKSMILGAIAEQSGVPIVVTTVMGDGEAFQLAEQVKAFLENEGHQVNGVDQVVYNKPVMGQSVNVYPDKVEIVIGTRQ